MSHHKVNSRASNAAGLRSKPVGDMGSLKTMNVNHTPPNNKRALSKQIIIDDTSSPSGGVNESGLTSFQHYIIAKNSSPLVSAA